MPPMSLRKSVETKRKYSMSASLQSEIISSYAHLSFSTETSKKKQCYRYVASAVTLMGAREDTHTHIHTHTHTNTHTHTHTIHIQ